MLVLSRKIDERIVMPELNVTLTVLAIEGNTVRLGITAPTEVRVYREELWNRVRANAAAPAAHNTV